MARLIGINHVALEVGDVEAALALYAGCSRSSCAGGASARRSSTSAISSSRSARGGRRGLTTGATSGSWSTTRRPSAPPSRLKGSRSSGIGHRLDFLDPWGNRFEIVAYADIQFERAPGVKRKLGIEALEKPAKAREEIAARGLDPH